MDITPYVKVAEIILAAIFTYIIVPYIKAKLNNERLEKLRVFVKTAVQAAEMIFNETGMGKEKKQYVINCLADAGYKLDEEELDLIIESAVLELKNNLE